MAEKWKKNEIEDLKRQLARLDGSNPQHKRMKQALQKKYDVLKEERATMKKSRYDRLRSMNPQQAKKLAEIRASMKSLDIRDGEQRTKRKKLKDLYRKIRDNPDMEMVLPPDLMISSPTTAVQPEFDEREDTASDNSSDGRSRASNEPSGGEQHSLPSVLQENSRAARSALIKRQSVIGNYTVYINESAQEFNRLQIGLENIHEKIEKDFKSTEEAISALRTKQEVEIKELFQQIQKCENDCLRAQTRQKREKEVMLSTIKEFQPQNIHVTVAGALISLLKYCLYMTAKMRDMFLSVKDNLL